jgi:Fic-DOC domain mobile mystery protein B
VGGVMRKWKGLPGDTPIDDFSELLVKGIKTKRELAVVEAENIREAVVKYLAKRPTKRMARFDVTWLLQLHREMLGHVWAWAGKVRPGTVNIGVPQAQIEPGLHSLASDLASWTGFGHDLLSQSTWLHHRAVQIHPFKNGNGRWSRLLANIWLKLNRHPLTVWPEQKIGSVSIVRGEYIKAVQAADAGDYEPLLAMHRMYTLMKR